MGSSAPKGMRALFRAAALHCVFRAPNSWSLFSAVFSAERRRGRKVVAIAVYGGAGPHGEATRVENGRLAQRYPCSVYPAQNVPPRAMEFARDHCAVPRYETALSTRSVRGPRAICEQPRQKTTKCGFCADSSRDTHQRGVVPYSTPPRDGHDGRAERPSPTMVCCAPARQPSSTGYRIERNAVIAGAAPHTRIAATPATHQ